jgi:hypothetical protein
MGSFWKNSRTAYAMAFTSAMLPHATATQNQGASLCTLQEETVFACTLKNLKAVAVCASHPPDASPGYLQYRFGKSGKVEINVPEKVDSGEWRKQFKAKRLWYSAGGGNYLRVDRGQYAYVVFSAFGRWGEKDGVMVWKSGAMVAHHACVAPALSKLGPDLPSRWGIGEDPEELVLP